MPQQISSRRWVALCCVAALLWSWFKGLPRRPNGWAYAQALLTFEDGVVRRGLVGQLLLPWVTHGEAGRQAINSFAYGCQGAFLAVCVAWIVLRLDERPGSPAPLFLVFVGSPLVWNVAACLGYLDAIWIALLLVVTLAVGRAPVAALLLSALAVTVHEAALVFVGVLVAARVVAGVRGWWREVLAFAAIAAWAVWLSRHTPSEALRHAMLARDVAPPERVDAVVAYLRDDLPAAFARVRSVAGLWRELGGALVRFALPTLWMAAWVGARAWSVGLRARAVGLALLVAAPLALLAIALDFERVIGWSALAGLLVADALRGRASVSKPRPRLWLWSAALLAVLCLSTPPRFTYQRPAPHWLPPPVARSLPDPLGRLAEWSFGR